MTRRASRAQYNHPGQGSSGAALPLAPCFLILLVERELAARLRGANDLLDEGYDIIESESVAEAVRILRGRSDFDAMVADIDEEHVAGGLALIRYAASHHPAMKILVNTAQPGMLIESKEVVTDFLAKPYPAGGLARRMRTLLGQRPPREQSISFA